MKTTVLSVLVLLACMGTAKSQVGINQKQPKATLDVMASNEIAIPDGVLVPRMPLSLLKSKNNAYSTDQHGALIYVTEIDESPYGKTSLVKELGFYYYNGKIQENRDKWLPLVSAAEESTALNVVTDASTAPYTITGNEDIILFTGADTYDVNLTTSISPTPTIGKKIYLHSANGQREIKGNGLRGDTSSLIYKGAGGMLLYVGNSGGLAPWIFFNGF